MVANGYWGKLLRVDLCAGTFADEVIEETVFRKFLGGTGLASRIIHDEVAPETDAFDPDNRLVVAVGPWQAANFIGSGKVSVAAKSPLSGTLGNSSGGNRVSICLKGTGYDALVVQGRAESPVYLWIEDGRLEIRSAAHLWGRETDAARGILLDEFAPTRVRDVGFLVIGPAGEKKVRFAGIATDDLGFCGRCGLGAVMGSKNLKAIVIRPTRTCSVNQPENLKQLKKDLAKLVRENCGPETLRHGTITGIPGAYGTGNLPVRNWTGDLWEEGARKVGVPRYTEELKVQNYGCVQCPILCKRKMQIDNASEYGVEQQGPQYESLALMGPNLLIDDLATVSRANSMCSRLGMDTIAVGNLVGFTIECYERGMLDRDDLGGLEPRWGDAHTLLELIRMIGAREGFGDVLAEGSVRAGETVGGEARDIPMQVRGMDSPAWDVRAFWGAAVNYATGAVGASHCQGMIVPLEFGCPLPDMGIDGSTRQFVPDDKALLAARSQDIAAILGSLTMCAFMVDWGGLKCAHLTETLNAITGWQWPVSELVRAGERISTLQRLINVRDGKGKAFDKLPPRAFEPAKRGPRAGKVPPMDRLLSDYYAIRGWDDTGVPGPAVLSRLDLEKGT